MALGSCSEINQGALIQFVVTVSALPPSLLSATISHVSRLTRASSLQDPHEDKFQDLYRRF